ncbi:choice-of-anchor U domain-containing protein [Congregibacter sp.]|uniref:choice-of-anchor U domain-containing protein n=1 Tax=Congregibacter sp. TaxID=2744308 RepID=UPI003F6C0636
MKLENQKLKTLPKPRIAAALIATAALFTSEASLAAAWVDWTDAPDFTGGEVIYGTTRSIVYTPEVPLNGTIADPDTDGTIAVTFSGEVLEQSCIGNGGGFSGCPLWPIVDRTPSSFIDGTYLTSLTGNDDHIAITGEIEGATRFTLKFSKPVSDLVLSLYSLGNPSFQGGGSGYTEGRWKFFQPWVLVALDGQCQSALDASVASDSNAGDFCLTRVESTNSVSGSEGDGLILFPGENTEISWDITGPEIWAGFNVGIAEAAYSENIVYINASDSASAEGATVRTPRYVVAGLSAEDSINTTPTCQGFTDLNFDTALTTSTPAGEYVTHCSGATITDNAPLNNYVTLYQDGTYNIAPDTDDDGIADTIHSYVDWTTNTAFNTASGPGIIGATVSKGNKSPTLVENLLANTFAAGADTNYPSTWYSPLPIIGTTEYSGGNIEGGTSTTQIGDGIDITVTFDEAVPSPRFHFTNLDAAKVTFLGDAANNLSLISGNDELTLTGADVNLDPEGTAALGGCENLDGSNPNGACGSIQVSGSYSSVAFRVSASQGTGDGFAWTVSTPTYTVTPSSDANSSLSTETAFEVNEGKGAILSLSATSGYEAQIGGTCTGTLDGNTFTLDAVTADCTVTATSTIIDTDEDTVPDIEDNCSAVANPNQGNLDSDDLGDACDDDVDGDGILNGDDLADAYVEIIGDNPGNCVIDIPATKLDPISGADAETAPADPINSKLRFRLLCDVGATATIRASFGEVLPPNPAAFKLDNDSVWTRVESAVFNASTNTVTYQITDNSSLDENGLLDGIIVDPVSVVSLSASATPVPIPFWALISLIGGIGFGAHRVLRRRT